MSDTVNVTSGQVPAADSAAFSAACLLSFFGATVSTVLAS